MTVAGGENSVMHAATVAGLGPALLTRQRLSLQHITYHPRLLLSLKPLRYQRHWSPSAIRAIYLILLVI